MKELAVQLISEVVSAALPVAIVIEVTNIIVKSFLRVAFGGRLWFGG